MATGTGGPFTLLCEGWIVSIDVFGRDQEEALEVQRLPSLGVSADCTDHDGVVSISVARSAAEHVTHHVHSVRRIYVEVALDGSKAGLLIESGERARTGGPRQPHRSRGRRSGDAR